MEAENGIREAMLEKELAAIKEALTPSGATKCSYHGEFSFESIYFDEEGNELIENIFVPWTTIKEIMKAIRDRAEKNNG